MEYKIYNLILKYKIPLFLRIIIMLVFFLLWFFSILLPLPFSIPLWIFLIIIWSIFVIWVRDIKFLQKIRKGSLFFAKNIFNRNIRNYKIKDIKKHVRQILNNNR